MLYIIDDVVHALIGSVFRQTSTIKSKTYTPFSP